MPLADLAPRPAAPADPVTEAVVAGHELPGAGDLGLKEAVAEARDLLAQARRDLGFRASLPRVLELVRRHPESDALQIAAGRLIMEDGDINRAHAAWAAIHQRFPEAAEPFRMLVRMTLRLHGETAADAVLHERVPDPSVVEDEPGLLALAFGNEELGNIAEAEDAFQRLTRLFPRSRTAWRQLARLQEARGGVLSAQRTMSLAVAACGAEEFAQANARLTREIHTLESLAPGLVADNSPFSIKAMRALLADILAKRKADPPRSRGRLGSTLMISGSLGSGGAERQLVTTVMSLHRAAEAGRSIGGYDIAGPVQVACRSLAPKRDYDFFLKTLEDAGVPVTEYGRLEPFGGRFRASAVRPYSTALDFLPARMKEGATQLVDFLRYEAPDVVHVWQDGMVLAAGLAAVMARIPRIVLSVRTLPPTDRVNRWKLELEPLYRALLSAPGVVLTANSTLAARRYEEWLGLPAGSVPVIYNGVAPLAEAAGQGDEAMWRGFNARAGDADFTVGAVMRLDHNKRPLEFLSVAEALHRRRSGARFILVGDGPLRQEAEEYAGRLGILDRVLFTGRSGSVGYWLARMDAMILMSRFEGMPNVLIEAQLAGLPVVTTPAGGAPETVIASRTGFILGSAEQPDIEEAAGCLERIAATPADERAAMGEAARAWATRAFSVETMLERTVEVFMAPFDEPMLIEAAARAA